jgi:hypothetical protein
MSLDDRTVALIVKIARQAALETCSYGGADGERGRRGRPGLDGQQGAQGLPGATGNTGATGPAGLGSTGPTGPSGGVAAASIIPFGGVSGALTGVLSTSIGFGIMPGVATLTIVDGVITAGIPVEMTPPRDGTITDLTAAIYFPVNVVGVTFTLQLYLNDTAIPGMVLNFTSTGVVTPGWTVNQSVAGAVAVTTADRLALVATSSGAITALTLGVAAGVAIS